MAWDEYVSWKPWQSISSSTTASGAPTTSTTSASIATTPTTSTASRSPTTSTASTSTTTTSSDEMRKSHDFHTPKDVSDVSFGANSILTALVPRPTAWLSVYPAQTDERDGRNNDNKPEMTIGAAVYGANGDDGCESAGGARGSGEAGRAADDGAAVDDGAADDNGIEQEPINDHDPIDPMEPIVCLIEGYCGASDRPPTLMIGSDAISPRVLEGLRTNGVGCLSVATIREFGDDGGMLKRMSAPPCTDDTNDNNCTNTASDTPCDTDGQIWHGPAKTFCEAGLIPCPPPTVLDTLPIPPVPPVPPIPDLRSSTSTTSTTSTTNATNDYYYKRPPAVDSSPVHMHCRLAMEVPLHNHHNSNNNHGGNSSGSSSGSTMILLQVDTYVIRGDVLRKQSTLYPSHVASGVNAASGSNISNGANRVSSASTTSTASTGFTTATTSSTTSITNATTNATNHTSNDTNDTTHEKPSQPSHPFISLHGNPDVRIITAKIDGLLLRPLASLGNGRFGVISEIYHMGRPRPIEMPRVTPPRVKPRVIPRVYDGNVKKNIHPNHELNEESCNHVNWESPSLWEIDDLLPAYSVYPVHSSEQCSSTDKLEKGEKWEKLEKGDGQTITYTYRIDPHCPLGYNPMKQVVCPRFIGWISSYEPDSLNQSNHPIVEPIAHISPYSFFIDVARGSRPMVAFAACPRTDEFDNSDSESDGSDSQDEDGEDDKDGGDGSNEIGNDCPKSSKSTKSSKKRKAQSEALSKESRKTSKTRTTRTMGRMESTTSNKSSISNLSSKSTNWKDAQRDAEETGVFCVNVVSQELAWAMNASAAPLGKGLSEFQLMSGGDSSASASVSGSADGSAIGSANGSARRSIPTPVPAPSIPAPAVPQSPILMECHYRTTVKIPEIKPGDSMYSLIVGEVVNIHVRKDVLLLEEVEEVDGVMEKAEDASKSHRVVGVDIAKVKPVSRLGYGQEYTVISEFLT